MADRDDNLVDRFDRLDNHLPRLAAYYRDVESR